MYRRPSSSLFATVSPLVAAALLAACGAPLDADSPVETESLALRGGGAHAPKPRRPKPDGMVIVAPASGASNYRGFQMPIVESPLPAPDLIGFAFGDTRFAGGVNVAAGDVNGDGRADIVVGPATGGGLVRVLDAETGNELLALFPFGETYTGGVFVATGDVNGDGAAEIILGGGGGGQRIATVQVVDGNGQILFENAPFEGFSGGVSVAAGDINGDGRADIVAGANASGGTANVKVFDGATGGTEAASLFPFPATYAGGVNVAVGDINGDGFAEIVAGAAAGPPHVKVFSCPDRTATASAQPELLAKFLDDCQAAAASTAGGGVWKTTNGGTWDATYTGGVYVAAGDVNGDGRADIAVGAATGPARVKVIDGTRLAGDTTSTDESPLFDFFAYDLDFNGGATVALVTYGPVITIKPKG